MKILMLSILGFVAVSAQAERCVYPSNRIVWVPKLMKIKGDSYNGSFNRAEYETKFETMDDCQAYSQAICAGDLAGGTMKFGARFGSKEKVTLAAGTCQLE